MPKYAFNILSHFDLVTHQVQANPPTHYDTPNAFLDPQEVARVRAEVVRLAPAFNQAHAFFTRRKDLTHLAFEHSGWTVMKGGGLTYDTSDPDLEPETYLARAKTVVNWARVFKCYGTDLRLVWTHTSQAGMADEDYRGQLDRNLLWLHGLHYDSRCRRNDSAFRVGEDFCAYRFEGRDGRRVVVAFDDIDNIDWNIPGAVYRNEFAKIASYARSFGAKTQFLKPGALVPEERGTNCHAMILTVAKSFHDAVCDLPLSALQQLDYDQAAYIDAATALNPNDPPSLAIGVGILVDAINQCSGDDRRLRFNPRSRRWCFGSQPTDRRTVVNEAATVSDTWLVGTGGAAAEAFFDRALRLAERCTSLHVPTKTKRAA